MNEQEYRERRKSERILEWREQIIPRVGEAVYKRMRKSFYSSNEYPDQNCAGLVAYLLGFRDHPIRLHTDSFMEEILAKHPHERIALTDGQHLPEEWRRANISVYRESLTQRIPGHIALLIRIYGRPYEFNCKPGTHPLFEPLPRVNGIYPLELYHLLSKI